MKLDNQWTNNTGLLLVVLLLVYGHNNPKILFFATVVLCILMFVPKLLYPVSCLWFKVAVFIAMVVPKIFFSIVFFCIVTPVAYVRRLFVSDAYHIKLWDTTVSTLRQRNHTFSKRDMETVF